MQPKIAYVIPGCDGFMRNEIIADVLDGLGDRIDKDTFGGDSAGACYHSDRIDDWHGVEKSLDTDVPD